MKISKYNIVGSLAITVLFWNGSLLAKKSNATVVGNMSPSYKTSVASTGDFDGNRVRDDLENNGMIVSHRVTGHSGMEWPKDNHTYTVYASGVWMAGKVDGGIRTACAEYGPENVSGPYGGDASSSTHKLYKVSKSDLADPLANSDFQNWPVAYGAPWVDVDSDGTYDPLPNGNDYPEFIGDQVVWYVSNDGDATAHTIFGTLPLGVEVQTTIFGFDRPDAFGDMMFVKELIINKGGNTIDDLYIGLWSDPDLGNAGDDWVGCDTTLGLGFCYNDGVDSDYAGYSGGTPAVGYDFFQGPMVASAGDTAFMFGQSQPGFKNLSMSSFVKYINTDDPLWSDPNYAEETYNLMQGLMKTGEPFPDWVTGGSNFVHPGDPSLDTGDSDTEYIDADGAFPSGDRRFLMNTGPFTMAPGDSQEVVFAIFMAAAGGPLQSLNYLKEVDALAQLAYDIQFALPESPPAPEVSVTTLEDQIIMTWDNAAESYSVTDVIDKLPIPVAYDTTWDTSWVSTITSEHVEVIDTAFTVDVTTGPTGFEYDTIWVYNVMLVGSIDTTFQGQNTTFKFEGYNVYQYETASGTGNIKRIATYDLINNITEIFDDVFDPNYGETINRRVQFGNDSGIKRYIQIDVDALNNNSPLITNRVYYFAVVAYGYNQYGIPKTLESPLQIMTIRPQVLNNWAATDSTATVGSAFAATHSAGASDGSVTLTVVDPTGLTGDSYSVSFADTLSDGSSVTNWTLTNSTDGAAIASEVTIQGGVDFIDATTVGASSNPVVEGFLIEVDGPPLEFKDFYATANAGGDISGYAGAAADYNGYPGMGRTNIGNQQTNGSTWFITTSNSSNKNYEDFYPYITRYTAGYGNPNGGIKHLIPDDFEFRFTETGGKMWDDENGVFIDIPMEVWNVGVVADPADDFQLLPMYWDPDGNGVWDLAAGDHAVSGGTNDPYMESFYVLEHYLQEPGTTGYDAIIAALTADPTSNGAMTGYIWASSPNYLGVSGQITSVVLLNMTFANWNGGDVNDPTFPANVDAVIPETGTIFRMVTTKPNNSSDVFTFSTSSNKGEVATYSSDNINVWPNPYFGFNPEERNTVDQQIQFTHLPETGDYSIRIFDLAGTIVKVIDGSDVGSQYAVWDVKNNFGIPVASGMYLAHVTTASGEKVLKLGVVQPEQRIDRY